MRKQITFIKCNRGGIHFCIDIKGVPSAADLFFMPEANKSLFENIEMILTRLGEAHNVTDIEQLNDFDYRVTYNAAEEA